ncbi:uncharacterized protein LOC141914695 [Tubulanus polymorphus]|uniref:uncharacterized protein LOC141914695 n=1 Tax=Tubulanus polymorphus TaxID=672921 RepID=UPI003DA2B0C9
MEMTTVKTVAVFVIMFGCFAVLYPKIFHPMILQIFGFGFKSKSKNLHDDGLHPRLHPRERMNSPKASPPYARPGVHPGMRAAAEMRKQAAAAQVQQGSGRGMIGYMLPLYAVGIIVYLVYTMSKVFVKSDSDKKSDVNAPTAAASGDKPSRDPQREIADMEMTLLRKRLEETETQMQRILAAMETVKQRTTVTPSSGDNQNDEHTATTSPPCDEKQSDNETTATPSGGGNQEQSPKSNPDDDDCYHSDDYSDESSPSNSADEYDVNSSDPAISNDLLTLKNIQHHLETVAEKLEPLIDEDEEEESVTVETISAASVDNNHIDSGLRQRTNITS